MDDSHQTPAAANADARPDASLGARLRARRKAQRLTLHQVADAAGLSIGFISQVERDLAAPSLSSLAAIAAALSAPVGAFLHAPAPEAGGLTHAAARMPFHVTTGGAGYERLSTRFPGSTLRALLVHQPPGPRPEPMRHPGEELFLILSGALSVELEGVSSLLARGDSIHFDSRRQHSVWNHTTAPATMLWCGTMDLFDDRQAEASFGVTA